MSKQHKPKTRERLAGFMMIGTSMLMMLTPSLVNEPILLAAALPSAAIIGIVGIFQFIEGDAHHPFDCTSEY